MNLANVELIQGVVIDVDDPKKQGRIKCVIPGVFEAGNDKEGYPWINPFGMTRYQSFSKEMTGAKVWVVQNKDNYNEFYYIPLFDKISVMTEFLEEKYEANPEVVFMRDNAGQTSQITYDQEDGIIIKANDSYVKVMPTGEINCVAKNANVILRDGMVYIGGEDGGDYEPTVFANKLISILADLQDAMTNLQQASSAGAFDNASLVDGFSKAVQALSPINDIKTTKTMVN